MLMESMEGKKGREAVSVKTAQSAGEPSTQKTLNPFHLLYSSALIEKFLLDNLAAF